MKGKIQDKQNKKGLLKNILIISTVIVFIIIFLRVVFKIIQGTQKTTDVVYEVETEKLRQVPIKETILFQGIAEGDPQVKVYSKVSGKFEKRIVNEGDFVKKDAILFYINRDMPGFEGQLAPVNSPITGVVLSLYYFDKGAFIDPQKPVGEIANQKNIKVVLKAGEDSLVKIKKGQRAVLIPSYKGQDGINGFVDTVSPFINKDTLSGTVIVKASNNEDKITVGMSVDVVIDAIERQGFMVPQKAVLMGEDITYIFINDNNMAKRIDVKTGYMENDRIEIISEKLQEGMDIIVSGSYKLNENLKVKVK
jgi:multidrug efflux pump subunit AcrA (membrane-fusion protein)